MKKLFVLLTTLCVSLSTFAQNSSGGCYRGFFDCGYSAGLGGNLNYGFGRFEINTAHGFQINPFVFVGGGCGLHFMPKFETSDAEIPLEIRESSVDIPVFGNVRGNFGRGKIVPFADAKLGTYLNNNGGLYYNLSAGCRFAVNEKQAVNFSVGYTSSSLEFQHFGGFVSLYSMDYYRVPKVCTADAITIKIGYEF